MDYQLKLGNIMAFCIAIFTGWLFWKLHPEVGQAITSIAHIGPGNPAEVRLGGCIALGILVLMVVSFAKLVAVERRNDE